MVELWIIIVMLCLLTATGSALLALRLQYRALDNTRQEREAWQQAQEGRQRTWEVRQGKHILDAEKKLADQLKEARHEWRDWGAQLQQEHQEWRDDVDLSQELARLPHVEHVELAHQSQDGRLQPKDWRPPMFYKVELPGHDFSHRYLERADLREANLREASLYMADLTGASLAGANLEQADLLGANLSGADLRGANLVGANLLVADLHNAVLHGANLTGARNLTLAQLQTAIYDSTTLIDSSIDITLPRIPGVKTTPAELLTAASTEIPPVAATVEAVAIDPTPAELLVAFPMEIPSVAAAVEAVTIEPLPADESGTGTPDVDSQTDEASAEAAALPSAASTPIIEEAAPVPVVVEASLSADTSMASSKSEEEAPASSTPVGENGKKSSSSRKRTGKTKQAASAAQTSAKSHKSGTGEENEEPADENVLPNKIIQWPARVSKSSSLPDSSDQSKSDKLPKKQGNSRTANFSNNARATDNHHAQAN